MGATGSRQDHSKDASAHEVGIHRRIRQQAQRAGLPRDLLLTSQHQPQPLAPQPDRPGPWFRLTTPGPPAGNDLFDLFLARYDAAAADPTARWQLVCAATQALAGVLRALAQLHRLGVAHGDVKPENAVLDRDAGGRAVVRLIDFGASSTDPREWQARYGTQYFRAYSWLPSRRRGPTVQMLDPLTNRLQAFCRLAPPSRRDDVFRALSEYHRLVTNLDEESAGAWDEPPVLGGAVAQGGAAMPPAQLAGAIRHAAAGDADAARRVEQALAAESPERRLHLAADLETARMLRRCFNVAAVCSPDDAAKASAWAMLDRLFRLPD
jgi:hypothetical protein